MATSVALAIALAEGVLGLVFHVPLVLRLLPTRSLGVFQQVYLDEVRHVIQLEPRFARYDPDLFYTLKPGDFVFENAEYRTAYHVNRAGLRDREDALVKPQAIVLGDSFAMGWGVEQDDAFAKVLERQTGMPVLNAGVSSYGTAREFRLLERLDTSALRYLIIQYCENDGEENRAYIKSGYQLAISPPETLQQLFGEHARATRYRPGKYLHETVEDFIDRIKSVPPPPGADRATTARLDAHQLIEAILHANRTPLDRVQLIVFETNQYAENRPWFAEALRLERSDPHYPAFIHDMAVLDLSPVLTRDTYYVLDDHIRPEGHRIIADALARVIRERGAP